MISDAFALLGVTRKPWIDPEVLKEHFREKASRLHPDKEGGDAQDFALLNQAFGLLREPSERLQHLVELEFGPKSAKGAVFPRVGALLGSISELSSASQTLLTRANGLVTAIGKVAVLQELRVMHDRSLALLKEAGTIRRDLEHQLRESGEDWKKAGPEPWRNLAAEFRYLLRAEKQLRETEFRLAMSLERMTTRLS